MASPGANESNICKSYNRNSQYKPHDILEYTTYNAEIWPLDYAVNTVCCINMVFVVWLLYFGYSLNVYTICYTSDHITIRLSSRMGCCQTTLGHSLLNACGLILNKILMNTHTYICSCSRKYWWSITTSKTFIWLLHFEMVQLIFKGSMS